MKQKVLILLAIISFSGFYVSAEQQEKRTGFFAVDLMGEVTLIEEFQYFGSSLDLKFGGQLAPQHTLEFGIRLPHRGKGGVPGIRVRGGVNYNGAVLLKYNYDFTENGQWIPGVSISALLGDSPRAKFSHRLKGGISFGGFVKKSISENMAVLLRVGISHKLIYIDPDAEPVRIRTHNLPNEFSDAGSAESPKTTDSSDLTVIFYLGVGVRWYLP